MLSLFTYWCSGVLLLGFSSFIPGTPAPDASQIDRVVVQSVRLLRPSGSGLVASDPVDVLIENGRVARVDQELIGLLKPGQMALRGRDLWMLPAPRLLLPGKTLAPSSSAKKSTQVLSAARRPGSWRRYPSATTRCPSPPTTRYL